jgi:dethiobiotin synthetase
MNKAKGYFITGIGTDVGKTVVSAIFTQALEADYWKPIQSGLIPSTDRATVESLVQSPKTKFWPEVYCLQTPASPHYAAALDGVEVDLERFVLPPTENSLIVEGAGGLMVPLNERYLVVDLIERLGLPVVLVSRNYLGSINHTLLSVALLQARGIAIAGLVFNGPTTPSTESFILGYTGLTCLGRVAEHEAITRELIAEYAQDWAKKMR